MKYILTILMIAYTLAVFGQTSEEYLESGILKHENQDLKGAIKDYTKAIKADDNNKFAFLNRGTCKLSLQDFEGALSDFSLAIEIDPDFIKARYARASVYVSIEKYSLSLPDLDKTIELAPTFPNALTLRGQIRAALGDSEGACEDFNLAKEIGDQQADTYLDQFCKNEDKVIESLELDWPKGEKWIVGSSQEDANMSMVDYINSDESLETWTEMGNMITINGITGTSLDDAMNLMFNQSKENGPKSKLTLIEKNDSGEYPWILFTIETPKFKNDSKPESQVWFVIQGKVNLYTNFWAIKKPEIPNELKEKWVTFFKTAKIVNN
jgi:tetratricopeptide (TPR) repeat protein